MTFHFPKTELNLPRFAEPIPNITVTIGKDALLACVVDNLKSYRVSQTHCNRFIICNRFNSIEFNYFCCIILNSTISHGLENAIYGALLNVDYCVWECYPTVIVFGWMSVDSSMSDSYNKSIFPSWNSYVWIVEINSQ